MIRHQIFIPVIPWLIDDTFLSTSLSLFQVRICREVGRPFKKVAVSPGHWWAHQNGIKRKKNHEMCRLFLRVPWWLISRFLCEAPCSQWVRGEEDDPRSHPKDPRRAAARQVQLPDGAEGVCPTERCTIWSTCGSSCLWNAAYFSPCFLAS